MKSVFPLLLRGACILIVSFTTAFALTYYGRQTTWYQAHLYRQLLEGDPGQRLHAASSLAQVGAESRLLAALKVEDPEVNGIARRALEHLWFHASGAQAYDMMEAAYQAAEKEDYQEALRILNRLTERFPKYAEGWNRRASVLWQLSDYERSMRDCQRVLALNPNHYGAWQGLGVCQLKLGDVADACHSLRVALKIAPHDGATRQSLQRCEELLRLYPAKRPPAASGQLL